MKIDIHVHTKKTKQGDAETRNITPSEFAKIIQSTSVKIIAITNHNVFDIEQFNDIEKSLDGAAQIWPGVELDIVDNSKRSHLIVIVSPNKRDRFNEIIDTLTQDISPDDFTISIEDTISNFECLEPLYIAHYKGKKPEMADSTVAKIIDQGIPNTRFIKEATNAISAGIFISHGHKSLYGSDVQDWSKYTEISNDLPELRLRVDSFEHFLLLLSKDIPTINTTLDRKQSETIDLIPFEDATKVTIKAFNDINIIFGPKGTGKTKILEAIARHYSNNGTQSSVFSSSQEALSDKFDIKGKNIVFELEKHGIDPCRDEIQRLKSSTECDITSLHQYRSYFQNEAKNKNAQIIKIKDFPTQSSPHEIDLKEYIEANEKLNEVINTLSSNKVISAELHSSEEYSSIISKIKSLSDKILNKSWGFFLDIKSIELFNSASSCYSNEVARKTGVQSRPASTGFSRFSKNRIRILSDSKKILENIKKNIPTETCVAGNLGVDKGDLKCTTDYKIQDGSLHDANYTSNFEIKKNSQKEFSNLMSEISKTALQTNAFDCITRLNSLDDIENITSIDDLVLFWRRFTLEGERYSPSNGECSMLNLHNELYEEKDIYILDEPERSLGNDYINDVIIPLIKSKATQGKKVFISTHDANIAVRTLPYNSMYRCHDQNGYSTYIGNPFSNDLVSTTDTSNKKDWKIVSMKTLEGGESAFGERGKIYGLR
ncbi:hypothetical protein [Aeromonas sp. AE23HZ002T15]